MNEFKEYEYIDYVVEAICKYTYDNNLDELTVAIIYNSYNEEIEGLRRSPDFVVDNFSEDGMDELIEEIKIVDDCFLGKAVVITDEINKEIICSFKIIRE